MNQSLPVPIRNVGIFAHVDAGKTTTTEHILYESGRIRTLGSVDAGTAQTDWLDVERERGISVHAAVTRFDWNGIQVNLIDTPGHVDFLAEVERSMRVLDGAVVIVSAVEGVQAQTEVVWQALRDLQIPAIFYINKMDRVGADPERTLAHIRTLLSDGAVPVQAPAGREEAFAGNVDLLTDLPASPEAASYRLILEEALAEREESLLEAFLEKGSLDNADLLPKLEEGIRRCELFPVLFGASSRGLGVNALMEAMVRWLPSPVGDPEAKVSGIVFRLERDPEMGRVAFMRLYNGTLRNRDTVHNVSQGIDEKVTQIRKIDIRKSEDVGLLQAGDVAAVYGFGRTRIGDILGSTDGIPGERRLAVPLLTVQVRWQSEVDYPKVVAAFQELADEDPHLDVQWLQGEKELHLKVMGPIQAEVLTAIMKSRYKLDVTFDPPSVIYKETPSQSGEGYIAYTMPKPCWAILRFRIEPGPRGIGLVYRSDARPERLLERYQNEVERRVPEALQQGLSGWEVTDLRVTLLEGEHHVWHTHPLDFAVATPMGIMNGLANTGTKLLEPLLKFRLSVPEEFGGKVINEIVVMRGEFDSPFIRSGRLELEGILPVATSLDFPARLGSMTKGRGTLATSFAGYQECPPDVRAERKRQGVNPLDQSKYILAVRNAITQ
ncbi:TetM/TetW/TetO/TetS family tetracycline resistance ribosomal protection protein [Paenibacillus aurantius]|uniref:TetM/TetW/TetO/TetS family tetracycline resistance ribosomal protection protein n=1 Tax=Paenibacillus aurantius TaxID=2918900 RepID=A0AA96LMS5_9BACL|nr:TetM/TetW/TetO/TetS family tetracycline resistance ribosomal protection protein [Paenibacillus aurantius]WNQ14042.1 TetM/TetW/TetO/TetS family tetracycline resistance ribosomal protection protein [Paenibacillus aurantius]